MTLKQSALDLEHLTMREWTTLHQSTIGHSLLASAVSTDATPAAIASARLTAPDDERKGDVAFICELCTSLASRAF